MSSVSLPTINNLTLTDANSEYSQVLPSFTSGFTVFARPAADGAIADLRLAFVSGGTGTTFVTIPGGSRFTPLPTPLSFPGARTIYLRSPTAGTVVEILSWS